VRRFTFPPKRDFSLDLHVLGTPPAFILSQDQTLQFDLDLLKTQVFDKVLAIQFSKINF
jgi:hypothetical protein